MNMTLTNSVVHQKGKEKTSALLEALEQDKEFQISVRMNTGLGRALEEVTRVWGFKNVSHTVRTILSFYFLPVIYQLEWKDKEPADFKNFLKEQEQEGFSMKQTRASLFLQELSEYMSFLEQTETATAHSLDFVRSTHKKLNEMLGEMQGKMFEAVKELEKEKKSFEQK